MQELDPNKPFEGLGIRGWLRVVFRTRAHTIKHCDQVIALMVDKASEARSETITYAERMKLFAALTVEQHNVLEKVAQAMVNANWYNDPGAKLELYSDVLEIIEKAKEPLA